MNSALGIYAAQGGTSFGNINTIYVSIPDPSATSTSGDQCQGLGLPTAPSGTSYFCEASSSYRNVNGNGWIPINFSNLSAGSPLGFLPQDPINTTTTGNYYTYATNGFQFIVTSLPESQKTKSSLATNPQIPDYPEVMAQGSNLTISPLWSPTGLVGYWNFEEGSGTTALDASGNGNNGTWSGTTPYYAGGKVGSYAGNFNGSNDYINCGNNIPALEFSTSTSFSIVAWFNISSIASSYQSVFSYSRNAGSYYGLWIANGGSTPVFGGNGNLMGSNVSLSQWHQMVGVQSGLTGFKYLYIDGILVNSSNFTTGGGTGTCEIGYDTVSSEYFNGLVDDVRIYSRALSAAEIQALYNAEK